ncbi:MAG: hypothetical protein ACTSRI_19095 [Promethearchaeota archaeon]
MKFQRNQLKYIFKTTLGMNFASIITGIIYLIIGPERIFGFLFTIILVSSWFLNIGLIFLDEFFVVKNHPNGKKINRIGYGFLMLQIIAILFLVAGNFLMNAQWGTQTIWYLLISIGFFTTFAFGSILAYANMKNIDILEVWNFE